MHSKSITRTHRRRGRRHRSCSRARPCDRRQGWPRRAWRSRHYPRRHTPARNIRPERDMNPHAHSRQVARGTRGPHKTSTITQTRGSVRERARGAPTNIHPRPRRRHHQSHHAPAPARRRYHPLAPPALRRRHPCASPRSPRGRVRQEPHQTGEPAPQLPTGLLRAGT
jgi:hypothetical protein